MKNKQLTLQVQADLDIVAQEAPTGRILEITVTAPQAEDRKDRPALNLALVLDRSGSMHGEKLEYVKLAAQHVVDLLDERDRVALVAYDDEINMLSTSLPVTAGNRERIKAAIRPLRTGGSTNLSGGWLAGCEQAAGAAQPGSLNRALLLTDGLANVGITDLEELAQHARQLSRRGVTTSTFGVGLDYNQHLLEAMANQGTGNYYFIASPQDIPGIFSREFEELAGATAQDVEIVLDLPAGIQPKVLGDWRTECSGQVMRIFLGSLYNARQQPVYLKLQVPPSLNNKEVPIQALVRGKDETGAVLESQAELLLRYTSQAEVQAAQPDKDLLERFALVDLAQAAKEALLLERQGQRDQAHRLLNNSVSANRSLIPEQLSEEYDAMSIRMQHGMDEIDRKESHYRSYLDRKQRGEWREYRLQRPDGHLMIDVDGQWVLLDSGSPASVGREPQWYLLGHRRPLSPDFLGMTTDTLSQWVGTKVDILLGADILKEMDVRVDGRSHTVTLSSSPLDLHGLALPARDRQGVPTVKCLAAGAQVELFFDTGAKLTYLSPDLVKSFPQKGTAKDFYPGFGAFETPVYEVPVTIAGEKLMLHCGTLPPLLDKTIRISGAGGILGVEIFDAFRVDFSLRRNAIHLTRY